MDRIEQPIVAVESLTAGYGDLTILHDVSLEVAPGSIVTVIGPNGAGKSTLLKAFYGFASTRSGRIMLETTDRGTVDILRSSPHHLVRLGINYVPQRLNIFPDMTVEENLLVGGDVNRHMLPELLEEMTTLFPPLGEAPKRRAGTLSGGQRGMLAVARALMTRPRVLLLDEPSAGLAPKVVSELFDFIVGVKERGVTIVMVEQNARRALAISDWAYVLDQGTNAIDGPGPDLLRDERVIALYLGTRPTTLGGETE